MGSRSPRRPKSFLYGNVLSHYRNEYTVFHFRRMWVNYIKKINLLNRVIGDGNNRLYFVTNKLEHVKVLSSYANKMGANVLFHEKAGQFTQKYFESDSRNVVKTVCGFGAKNQITTGDEFMRNSSRVVFTVSNNASDEMFFKDLESIDIDFAAFSTGDADSIRLQNFVSLFGNNDNFKSWQFFFKLFENASPFAGAFNIGARSMSLQYGLDIQKKSFHFRKNAFEECRPLFYKIGARKKMTRSVRAIGLLNFEKSFHYDPQASVFGQQKSFFNYI